MPRPATGWKPVPHARALTVLLVAVCAPLASAQTFGRNSAIIDNAGVIDTATEAGLNRWLLELEKKTTAQLRILTVESTRGRDLHSYALDVAKANRLGKAGEDNGVLVLIAVKDRRYRIEVGEGIEDTIPDLFCDRVARKYFVPNFRQGNFGMGIYQGTIALAQKIAADRGVRLTGQPPAPAARSGRRGRSRGSSICSMFSLVLFFVFFMGSFGLRRRGYRGGGRGGGGLLAGLLIGGMLGNMGRGGSSWGGGGFGGGGFGGFGGGGGGSFGGGGAGGGW